MLMIKCIKDIIILLIQQDLLNDEYYYQNDYDEIICKKLQILFEVYGCSIEDIWLTMLTMWCQQLKNDGDEQHNQR